jgi:hypothetical protein
MNKLKLSKNVLFYLSFTVIVQLKTCKNFYFIINNIEQKPQIWSNTIFNSQNLLRKNIVFMAPTESNLKKLMMSGKNLERPKRLAQILPPSSICLEMGTS